MPWRRPTERPQPAPAMGNHVRFRLSPQVGIALGARAKEPGEGMVGRPVELSVLEGAEQGKAGRMEAYERLLGDAMAGDATLFARQDVVDLYQEIIDALNHELSQFERIKRIALLPREFSVESGELTPTLKVKRRVVEEKWRERIEALYRD